MTRFAAELMGVLKGQSLSDETEKRIRFTPVRIAEFRFPFFIHEKQKSNTFSFFQFRRKGSKTFTNQLTIWAVEMNWNEGVFVALHFSCAFKIPCFITV